MARPAASQTLIDVVQASADLDDLLRELYPLPRSITGVGYSVPVHRQRAPRRRTQYGEALLPGDS